MSRCACEDAERRVTPLGTVLKMTVECWYKDDPSVILDDMNFYVEYYCTPSRVLHIKKEELIRKETVVDDATVVNWYAVVDTNKVGKGYLKFRMYAEIPDSDMPGGVRPEYEEYDTGEIIG